MNSVPLILIAEDTPDVLMVLLELLEMEGYRVHTASDGQAAWDYLQACHHVPDLIITDYMMPRLNGLDLLIKVKQTEKIKNIPCMLYSASAHIKKDLLDIACSFIAKPFDMDLMLTKINNALTQKGEKV